MTLDKLLNTLSKNVFVTEMTLYSYHRNLYNFNSIFYNFRLIIFVMKKFKIKIFNKK